MAQILCRCGMYLSNCACPNEITGVLLRDLDLEFEDSKNCSEIWEMGRDIWECPGCGRLLVSAPDRHDVKVQWYKPEDDDRIRLLAREKKARTLMEVFAQLEDEENG